MNDKPEWNILDISGDALQKALGCSQELFEKLKQGAQPAQTVLGIRIFPTPYLPCKCKDGSEVHAIVISDRAFEMQNLGLEPHLDWSPLTNLKDRIVLMTKFP